MELTYSVDSSFGLSFCTNVAQAVSVLIPKAVTVAHAIVKGQHVPCGLPTCLLDIPLVRVVLADGSPWHNLRLPTGRPSR